MVDTDADGKPTSAINVKQLVITLAVIGGLLLLAGLIFVQREMAFQKTAEGWATQRFGLNAPVKNRLSAEFRDEDQDLVADAPEDPASFISPEVIRFCYIPSGGEESARELWEPFLADLSTQLGIPVEYVEIKSIDAQLAALRQGDLHVTGLNTGSVPRAVNVCGFVPVCTMAGSNGVYGYKMQIIVPADSDVEKATDLKGKRITFVNPSSNSGFKAPVVLLQQQFDMQIDVDYTYGFSTSHDNSIQGIQRGEFAAAAVASDVLARMVAQGEINESEYRVVYESERFPPAALGHVHNLHPDMALKLREAMLEFPLADTDLQRALLADSSASFRAVSYKDDWSVIRLIDDALGTRHTVDEVPPDKAEGGVN